MTDISLRYLLFGEDKSATSTIGKVGGAFSKLGSQVGGEFGEILNKVGEGIDKMGEHAQTMGAKLTAVGAITAGVGVAFQLAGSKEAQGAAQLNAAIDATGASHEEYEKQVEGAIHANEKFGFGAADTQQALAKLTAATNSPDEALKKMGVTANLAASQHISMAQAATMVARVISGQGNRTLLQYGITMDKTKSKTEAGQEALNQLSQKLSGQASASVDSFGGKIRVVQTKIGDFTATIGQKFGPALTVAGPLLMGVGTILEVYKARQLAAAAATEAETVAEGQSVIGRVASTVATGAAAVATGIWTASQWALNTALDANPIALIIIGIVALIAVIILAWKHSETFRTVVTAAFHAVLTAVSAAFSWIKGHWPLLLGILTGPIGLAVLWITKHWGTITSFFKGVPKALGNAVSGVTSFLTAPFIDAFNRISDAWNSTVGRLHWSIPGWVPGLGGKSISAPLLPQFAAGVSGVISRPGMFYAGEGNNPEAISITPLSAGRHGGAGGGDTYNFTINALTPEEAGAAVERVLVKRKSRQGRLAFQ